MQRIDKTARTNWQQKVESIGFTFHSLDNLYWEESAYYSFNEREINIIEAASAELYERCLEAVQYVIDQNLYAEFGIPEIAVPLIEKSWEEEHPAIYGRFDLAYDGISPPKLLEFNADTPTSLFESAVVQWYWLEEEFKGYDQYNSIHEKLIAKWMELKQYLKSGPLYFTCVSDNIEDITTTEYLRDCASQAGLVTDFIFIENLGWNDELGAFVDLDNTPITNIFKLYPWEWMVHEEFGPGLQTAVNSMFWIEPAWKMVLSNKAILPILWKLFPNHPNLLPAYFERPPSMNSFVKKPLMSREGYNIAIVQNNATLAYTDGEYGEEGSIFQEYFKLPEFRGKRPVIGSWLVDGVPCGMGIRESESLITNNVSRYVPHVFR